MPAPVRRPAKASIVAKTPGGGVLMAVVLLVNLRERRIGRLTAAHQVAKHTPGRERTKCAAIRPTTPPRRVPKRAKTR